MKFLCDQCKAKYQISDDKVAGKTVRMKCRKCGHMIEVRAAVTETSVATGSPSEPPAATAAKPPPAKPATLPKSSLATSLSQAKPPPPRPTNRPDSGLATAFKSSMQGSDEAALLELSSQDEWYAAINGVPVGPIRIGELRRKAALGAVTDDSLVWQDGMEEWRPVKTVPELAALVREAAASGKPSLVSPEPPNVRGSVLPPAPTSMRPGPARPAPPRPVEPPRPGQAAARSNVVPINSRLATAEKLEEGPSSERFSIAPDPFQVPAAPAVPAMAPPAAAAASLGPPTAAAVASPAPAPVPVLPTAQPRQPNYIGIGMIVAFAAFGITLALVFRPQPQTVQAPPQVIKVEVPAAPTAAPVASAADTSAAPVDSAATATTKKPGPAVASNAKPAASAKPGVDLSGLLGGAGPNVASGGGAAGAGPGGSLSADQLQRVVSSHQLGVRRTCWERGASTMVNANETLSLTIGGDGHVQNASASGNDPVTGTCLEKEVRNWQFPAVGATSKVDIPFHFVRQ